MTTHYWYPGSSTCKKALRWLEGRGLTYECVHLVEATPGEAQLGELWRRSGLPLKRFFNTSGRVYRQGGYAERLPHMSDDQALAALAADGMLIKRPILETQQGVRVGFREGEWEALLS